MHFHLPKPLHGWREFAGEVGIIVVGVLIALTAEQLVDQIHWHRAAQAARESIGEEVSAQYFAASEISITQPCVDRQLQLLEQAVIAPGHFHPVPTYSEGPMIFALRAPSRSWSDHIWQTVSSDGTTAHLDRDTRLGLANFYALIDYMRAKNATAEALRLRLMALSRPIRLDDSTRATMVADIEQARGLYASMAVVANEVVSAGTEIGFEPRAEDLRADGSPTLEFCRVHQLRLGAAEPVRPS